MEDTEKTHYTTDDKVNASLAPPNTVPLTAVDDDEPRFDKIKANPVSMKVKAALGASAVVAAGVLYYLLTNSPLNTENQSEISIPSFMTKAVAVEQPVQLPQPVQTTEPQSTVKFIDPYVSKNSEIELFATEPPGDTANTETTSGNDAIVITPQEETQTVQVEPSQHVRLDNTHEIKILTDKIIQLEQKQATTSLASQTSIELQQRATTRLTALLTKLEQLNRHLATIEAEKQVAIHQAKQKSAVIRTVKPQIPKQITRNKAPLKAKLVGLDMWGGDRFAQIEYEGSIQLVAQNEMVGDWKIVEIEDNSVRLKNKHGDTYELTK